MPWLEVGNSPTACGWNDYMESPLPDPERTHKQATVDFRKHLISKMEKRRVVGGEKGRVVVQNRPDSSRFFKFPGQKAPHPVPAPAPWMDELPIQGEITFIKIFRIQFAGFAAVSGKIEDGQIEKVDRRCMGKSERQGFAGESAITAGSVLFNQCFLFTI